jgi:hypothetical protein
MGSGSGLIEVPAKHFSGGNEENHEIPLRITSVAADSQNEGLPNTSF